MSCYGIIYAPLQGSTVNHRSSGSSLLQQHVDLSLMVVVQVHALAHVAATAADS